MPGVSCRFRLCRSALPGGAGSTFYGRIRSPFPYRCKPSSGGEDFGYGEQIRPCYSPFEEAINHTGPPSLPPGDDFSLQIFETNGGCATLLYPTRGSSAG